MSERPVPSQACACEGLRVIIRRLLNTSYLLAKAYGSAEHIIARQEASKAISEKGGDASCEITSGMPKKKPSASNAVPESNPPAAASKALRSFRALIIDPDNINAEFERIGDWYYRETGFLRPGKSVPVECGYDSNSRENAKRFADWFDDKKREALAILSGEEGQS